jgi:hypothetical protein
MLQRVFHIAPSGGTYYAHPADLTTYSLSNWAVNRVQLVEMAAPNSGVYTAELDSSVAADWLVFSGAAQPSAVDAVAIVSLPDLHSIKAGARAALSGRWTNIGTGPNRDDISVTDIP